MSKSNIYDFVRYSNKINYVLGVKTLNIKNEQFRKTNNSYKIYGWVLTFSLFIWTASTFEKNVRRYRERTPSLSLISTYVLSQVTLLLLLLVVQVNNIIFGSRNTRMMLSLLLKTDMKIQFEKTRQNKYIKISVILTYLVYFIIKFIQFYINFSRTVINQFPYQCGCILADIHTIKFILETNLVARRFEVLNYRLKMLMKFGLNTYDEGDSILIRFWRTKNKHFSEDECIKNYFPIEKLLSAHNELSRVVEKLNRQYSMMVGKITSQLILPWYTKKSN